MTYKHTRKQYRSVLSWEKTYNTAENLLYRQRFVVFWKMIIYVLQQW